MSRYLNARIRVVRRLGPLPGLTKKITTRNRYPGEHDKKPGASSDYAIRLEEKQKLKYIKVYLTTKSKTQGFMVHHHLVTIKKLLSRKNML